MIKILIYILSFLIGIYIFLNIISFKEVIYEQFATNKSKILKKKVTKSNFVYPKQKLAKYVSKDLKYKGNNGSIQGNKIDSKTLSSLFITASSINAAANIQTSKTVSPETNKESSSDKTNIDTNDNKDSYDNTKKK